MTVLGAEDQLNALIDDVLGASNVPPGLAALLAGANPNNTLQHVPG